MVVMSGDRTVVGRKFWGDGGGGDDGGGGGAATFCASG